MVLRELSERTSASSAAGRDAPGGLLALAGLNHVGYRLPFEADPTSAREGERETRRGCRARPEGSKAEEGFSLISASETRAGALKVVIQPNARRLGQLRELIGISNSPSGSASQ
jgi:hypothetical protein